MTKTQNNTSPNKNNIPLVDTINTNNVPVCLDFKCLYGM